MDRHLSAMAKSDSSESGDDPVGCILEGCLAPTYNEAVHFSGAKPHASDLDRTDRPGLCPGRPRIKRG